MLSPSRQILVSGVSLVAELIPLCRRRRDGEAPDELAGELREWLGRRKTWGDELKAAAERGFLPLAALTERFGLSAREIDVLLVAVAPEVDPEFVGRLAGLREGSYFRGVDVELTLGLLFHSSEERFLGLELLSPDRALIREGLITLTPVGTALTPHEVEVRATSSLANYILERPLLSGPLAELCELTRARHQWDHVILPDEQKRTVWRLVHGEPKLRERLTRWGYDEVMPGGNGVVLLFAGPPGTGKTAFAHAIARRLERPILRVRSSVLAAHQGSLRLLLQEVFRVATLADAVVLLDDCEALIADRDARLYSVLESLEEHDGLLILTTNLAPRIDFAVARRILYRVDFEPPTALLREQIWEVHLPTTAPLSSDIDVPWLANSYELAGGAIRNTVLIALAGLPDGDDERLTMAALVEACESQLGARFDDLASKGTVDAGFERLVLPQESRRQLTEVMTACTHHQDVLNRWGFGRHLTSGRGVCVMFDGPPGTGKTFSAEILASALKLPLYRVQIPNVVSKWVGETERNLQQIFVRARAARALLLFDEADSLFGRRSTTQQSSNDRYANMEVNLLLQEIERYDGISVLTTNLFGNLDDALQRRIQFRVTFPFPKGNERARIWDVLMPPEAPISSNVDYDELGHRFELSGGHIKNALLRAAYQAMDAGGPIGMEHLVAAALAECRAQGKLVRDDAPDEDEN
ncbi:MAG: SpoVK/Ycf46/Vps4 family AAA+-type ATPase [Myxococcota bacterium]